MPAFVHAPPSRTNPTVIRRVLPIVPCKIAHATTDPDCPNELKDGRQDDGERNHAEPTRDWMLTVAVPLEEEWDVP